MKKKNPFNDFSTWIFIGVLLLISLMGTFRSGTSYNTDNEWHYRFGYLNGTVRGEFTPFSDNAQLIYSVNIDKGELVFQIYNADSILAIIPGANRCDTIKNIFRKGGYYQIHAIATKAKGEFSFKMQ